MKKRCFPWIAFLLLLSETIPTEGISGCTSVCLTQNGHVVFGNNLDWFIRDGMIVINKRNMAKRGCWFENPAEWVSKYASITVNQEGREFPSRGMNEAGLVIGEMTLQQTVYPDPDERFAINPTQWIQYQLDNCATLDTVSQPSTVWSLVFDVKKLRLYFRTSDNRNIRFVDLKRFDFSRASEVAILDVQCAGEGDMSGSMVPYSEERDAALVWSVYRQLESKFGPFTEELIQKVIHYPATTRCGDNP